MYLDADEVLVADDVQRLRALTGRTWREAFYLVETNHTGDLEDGTAITHEMIWPTSIAIPTDSPTRA